MDKLILYLLEASVTLALLYTFYALLLKRLTFFNLNRFFLLTILVFALVIPLLSFDFMPSAESVINRPVSELSAMRMAYYQSLDNWVFEARSGAVNPPEQYSIIPSMDVRQWLLSSVLLIYAVGVIALIYRTIWTYTWMHRLRKRHVQEIIDGVVVVKLPYKLAPFSFLNAMYVPEETCSDASFDQILAHEKTHIDQRHSIDLIFVQLIAAFLWFNPVVWQLIKSLKATHEYIVDKQMINQGYSLVEYQTLLLRQLISNNSYGLVHNFNLSFIKKRITMMKVKESGLTGKVKVAVALSSILLVGLMTAQSNAFLTSQPLGEMDRTASEIAEMQFFIDGVPLNKGLEFSKLKNSAGEFRFEISNDKQDNIHVGVELVRKGQKVGHASKKLQESASFNIGELLSQAELEDYLIIDIIDGPAEVTKLYHFPLFRESDNWEKANRMDLPPAPMDLFVDGKAVSSQEGVSFSSLKDKAFKVELEYVISEFVDFSVLEKQAGNVTVSLMRGKGMVTQITNKKIMPKSSIELAGLLKDAQKGDAVMIQIGDPNGFQISSMFAIQ